MKKVTVEYCTGIGLNMLFPEYIEHTFFVEYDDDDLKCFDLPPNPPIDLLWGEELEHA
jgi:hypothetical protein